MLRVQKCDELFSIFGSARKTALRLSEFCVGACAGEFFISAFFCFDVEEKNSVTNKRGLQDLEMDIRYGKIFIENVVIIVYCLRI